MKNKSQSKARHSLYEYVINLPAVDAHEHLLPEKERLDTQVDALYLFHQYASTAMRSAGMPENELFKIKDTEQTLELRWKLLSPFLDKIKHTGFAKPVYVALKDLYGFETLDDSNYQEASAKIQEENTAGFTERFLCEKGKITNILNCNYIYEQPVECSYPLMDILPGISPLSPADDIENFGEKWNIQIKNPDAYIACLKKDFSEHLKNKVIGLKLRCRKWIEVDEAKGQGLFSDFLEKRHLEENKKSELICFLTYKALELVPEYNFTVAAHTGVYAGVNCEYYRQSISNMIPLLLKYPEVHFDIFHLGYPWIDEAIAAGQHFSNATLNLTWCMVLNPSATERAMADLITAIPLNKVLAMGGDYWRLPDVAYGHLKLAREAFANALSLCVEQERIGIDDAKFIAKLWLSENAKEIYPLLSKENPPEKKKILKRPAPLQSDALGLVLPKLP